MKTFDDLVFNTHPGQIKEEDKQKLIDAGIEADSDVFSELTQARITFDNGHFMSIIFGALFYSNGVDTYEAWCKQMEDEPRGYLTIDEVTAYMKEIQELPKL